MFEQLGPSQKESLMQSIKHFHFALGLVAILVTFVKSPHVFADIVKLKNGGEVRGVLKGSISAGRPGSRLESRQHGKANSLVRIETIRGTVVEIDRHEIEFVSRRRLAVEIYETKAAKTPETVEDQLKLANWCRKNKLLRQNKIHLRKVIELDPNHALARRSLGYQRVSGGWMTRDEIFRSQGLVKYQGRYITPEELEIRSKSDDIRNLEKDWYKKIFRWTKSLTKNNSKNAFVARSKLLAIKDPHAVSAIAKLLGSRKERAVRLLSVQILAGIPGITPLPPLVSQSLFDRSTEVREYAFRSIMPERHRQALPYFLEGLKNPDNRIVRRAGLKLEEIVLEQSIPALIQAVTTFHLYNVEVPDNHKMTFNSDGTMGQKNILQLLPPNIVRGLLAGQYPYGVKIHHWGGNAKPSTKTVTVRLEQRNKEVLSALRKLTGENFNYDKRTWLLWYEANKVGFLSKSRKKDR